MTPQHLQQADQYVESLVHARINATSRFSWGIESLAIDERALASGQVKILGCKGIFPDGLPFNVGDRGEDSVEARPLEGMFPVALDLLEVFIAIPNPRPNAPVVGLDPSKAGPSVRYVAQSATVPDINTGRGEISITWAKNNLRILLGNETRDGFQSIRIAQLVRDQKGEIALRKEYVPPILQIGQSSFLIDGFKRLLSIMVGKQKSLAEARRMRTAASVDFQASDTIKFWLLHTINTFIPEVSHILDQADAHPEHCYKVLASLIGHLCTFATDGDPTSIPKFNYIELGDILHSMIDRSIHMLNTVVSENYVLVPLEKRDDGMYLGKFDDPKLPRSHEFYFEVKGVDETILRDRLPRLLKVGSWTQIGYILNAAMPGVKVAVEYRPPGAIPVKPGIVYLKLDQTGDYWNDIVGSGTIAIYQPIEPAKVDLRLLAVPTASN